MSNVYTKQLWGPVTNPVANVEILVATVPEGKLWVVRNVLTTYVGSGSNFNRLSYDGGATFTRWLQHSSGAANLTQPLDTRQVLSAGTRIYFRSDTAGTQFSAAGGYEFDE